MALFWGCGESYVILKGSDIFHQKNAKKGSMGHLWMDFPRYAGAVWVNLDKKA